MLQLLITVLLLSCLLSACDVKEVIPVDVNKSLAIKKDSVVIKEKKMWHQGKVIYLDLEGGFYGIVSESGAKFLPMSMPKEFLQSGAIIKFRGKMIKDIVTIQQWGQPFQIQEVELIKAGQRGNNQPIM